jgi:hypothetical protein
MEEIRKKAFEIIGATSKKKFCAFLGISRPTLNSRLLVGGWTYMEESLIKNLGVNEKGEIHDVRDNLIG